MSGVEGAYPGLTWLSGSGINLAVTVIDSTSEVRSMRRRIRLALVAGPLLAMFVAAGPVAAAGGGAAYGDCVAHHARAEGGFSGKHNPGMHRGFAGWTGSCVHA